MEALIPARNSQSYNRRAVTERSQRKNSSWKTTEYQISSITAQKFVNVWKLTFSTSRVTLEIFLTYTCGSRFKQPTWEPEKNFYHIWLFTTILLRKILKKHKICIWKMTFFSFSVHLQWFWIVTNFSIFRNILSDFWIVTLPKAALFSLLVRLWTFRALYPKRTRKVCKG